MYFPKYIYIVYASHKRFATIAQYKSLIENNLRGREEGSSEIDQLSIRFYDMCSDIGSLLYASHWCHVCTIPPPPFFFFYTFPI